MHWRPLIWKGSVSLQGYENLSNNIAIADLKSDLSQLKSIVKYYREVDDVGENPEWLVNHWFIGVNGAQGETRTLTPQGH